MDFVDLKRQQQRIKQKLEARIQAVLKHGQYVMGPEVYELEERLAEFIGGSQAISCASGTDALLLALMGYGIGPGDAVFTTPFTFVATAEVISLLGAIPVFIDIDPRTFNLDPTQLELAIQALKEEDPSRYPLPRGWSPNSQIRTRSLSPKGIIPVDLFGVPADYDPITAIAQKYGLFVIEDAAQSFGAEYKGRKTCSLADIACTSFFPSKPLGGYGDGGMCFTRDDGLADIMRSMRIHGQGIDKYENIRIGINGRLDTLQAAVLLTKFEIFQEEIDLRQKVADHYNTLLSPLALEDKLLLPKVPEYAKSVWAQYSVLVKEASDRNGLIEKLKAAFVPTAIYYPKPLHLQLAYAHLGYGDGQFPVSEDCARRIFSLPMHPYLKREDQETIARIIAGD
ncbi:MAG: DegT/DnrJ/EryC1/StrS family aminotransferase [Thermodesulfobacteriota bacterium]